VYDERGEGCAEEGADLSDVREACDRLVQLLMGKEEGEEEDEIPGAGDAGGRMVELDQGDAEDDEDEKIIDII
jgi:hypothetical protein